MKIFDCIISYLLLFLFLFNGSLLSQEERDSVTPQFSCSILSGIAPLSVEFTDQTTYIWGVGVTSWHWNFGDGETSTEQNLTHVYTAIDSHTVSLTVTDDLGYSYTMVQIYLENQ